MKIVISKHIIRDKIPLMKSLGWNITKSNIASTIRNPKWIGITRFSQPTAMSLVDNKHILRVVFEREHDIIKVITVHIACRGTYETTKD